MGKCKKHEACCALYKVAKQAISMVLNLGLRGLCQPGPQEHSPETCKTGSEQVDRSRTTLRCLHLLAILLQTWIASVTRRPTPIFVPFSKRRRAQATQRHNCQPPLPVSVVHLTLPFIIGKLANHLDRGVSGEEERAQVIFSYSYIESS